MTAPLAIPEAETGVVRLFAIDLPDAEARAFASDPGALARALGAEGLDARHVDVFPVSRVSALGLATFLAEGHGIAPADLAPEADMLEALEGHVAVVTSGAFRGRAMTLAPSPPLRLLGTWREDRPPVSFGALPPGTGPTPPRAEPPAPPRPGARPAGPMRRRFLTLLILILAILGFIVMNGGR